MSESQTELIKTPSPSPSDSEVANVLSSVRHIGVQRSTANAIVVIGVLALALCFPLMRVVVSDYTLGAQLALSNDSCLLPQVSSDVQEYCEQARAGKEPTAVQVSKAIVGSPIQTAVPQSAPPVSPATAPLQANPVPGQPGVLAIPLPNGTTGRLVLPTTQQPVPQENPTTVVAEPPAVQAQPPEATVIQAAPGSSSGPTTIIPIEPAPASQTEAPPPPPPAEESSSAVPPPPPVEQTTQDAPPPVQTTQDAPPPQDTTTEAPPPETTTQAPGTTTDTTTTEAPSTTETTVPPTTSETELPPTTTEAPPTSDTTPADQPQPSLLGQVVDSLFSSISGAT